MHVSIERATHALISLPVLILSIALVFASYFIHYSGQVMENFYDSKAYFDSFLRIWRSFDYFQLCWARGLRRMLRRTLQRVQLNLLSLRNLFSWSNQTDR